MCACIRNTNLCFFQCMHASQVGQHYILRPNFELWKRRHYPIIPTGMRSGRWQPGHQCESFHWSIIYTVWCTICLRQLSSCWRPFTDMWQVQNLNRPGLTSVNRPGYILSSRNDVIKTCPCCRKHALQVTNRNLLTSWNDCQNYVDNSRSVDRASSAV